MLEQITKFTETGLAIIFLFFHPCIKYCVSQYFSAIAPLSAQDQDTYRLRTFLQICFTNCMTGIEIDSKIVSALFLKNLFRYESFFMLSLLIAST